MVTHSCTEQILSVYSAEDIILSPEDKTDTPGSCLACNLEKDKSRD